MKYLLIVFCALGPLACERDDRSTESLQEEKRESLVGVRGKSNKPESADRSRNAKNRRAHNRIKEMNESLDDEALDKYFASLSYQEAEGLYLDMMAFSDSDPELVKEFFVKALKSEQFVDCVDSCEFDFIEDLVERVEFVLENMPSHVVNKSLSQPIYEIRRSSVSEIPRVLGMLGDPGLENTVACIFFNPFSYEEDDLADVSDMIVHVKDEENLKLVESIWNTGLHSLLKDGEISQVEYERALIRR